MKVSANKVLTDNEKRCTALLSHGVFAHSKKEGGEGLNKYQVLPMPCTMVEHGNTICIKDYLSSLMIGQGELMLPATALFPRLSLSLPACSLARLFTTLGLVLLFTVGLSPDRYAMECKFPALLECWGGCVLAVWLITHPRSPPPTTTPHPHPHSLY